MKYTTVNRLHSIKGYPEHWKVNGCCKKSPKGIEKGRMNIFVVIEDNWECLLKLL
jgi:hypothetical protein